MWILILTIMFPTDAVATVSIEFNNQARCQAAGEKHAAELISARPNKERKWVVFTCNQK